MELDDLSMKNQTKDLSKNNDTSNLVDDFSNELKEYLEKQNNTTNGINMEKQYPKYWKYQSFLEDNLAARIGISRNGAENDYRDDLEKAIDDSILKIAKIEGTLYRKQFTSHRSGNEQVYYVDKFENGKKSYIKIPANEVLNKHEQGDLIYQIDGNGEIKIRNDLKEEVLNLASQKTKKFREEEQRENAKFKKEGHMYEAFSGDRFTYLTDITEGNEDRIEDIDFVEHEYKRDGVYVFKNGKYRLTDKEIDDIV